MLRILPIFITYIFLGINFALAQVPVAIDVESLGLDNVDKKPETAAPVPEKIEEKKEETIKKISEVKGGSKPEEEESTGIIDKIQNFLHRHPSDNSDEDDKEDVLKAKTEEQKSDQKETVKTSEEVDKIKENKVLEEIKESKLAKEKETLEAETKAEKIAKENEEKRRKNSERLQELREQYLIKIDEDYLNQKQKIIPRKKEVGQFILEEEPPLPIMSYSRSPDNRHIPIQFTPKDNISILFEAISKDDVSSFNSAYENVANPNATNPLGDTIVTYSLLLQKHAVLASALSKGANPNMTNKLGYTPIDIAIELVDIKALELLVSNNADLNYIDAFGRNYLMHAARVGFLPAVQLFVSKGADVNVMDNDGFTALSIAYRHKKEVIVKYLLKQGAKTWIEKPYDPKKQSLIKELENRWK